MRVVSLFAGIGGFDLGFDRAGFEIVAHVEIDPQCRKLLTARWPDAVCLDDVRTAGKHNLPDCDVVTFGFPCQDLSVAGKRAGLAGGRSGLYYEATRIIDELKPAYCLFENVPGLLSSDGGRDFARVLMEMDRIGYSGAWRVLDAQYIGVAQRRRRCFGLFSRLDSGAERCAQVLLESEGVPGDIAKGREAGQGAPYSVAPCLAASGRGTERAGETRGQDCVIPAVAGTLDTFSGCDRKIGNQQIYNNHVVPAVAGCRQERDAKGADSDTKPGHLVPVFGFGGESDASSLSGSGDLQPPITGRHGAPGFVAHPVAFGGDVARTLAARHDSSPCADRGTDVVAVPVAMRESGQGYWMEDDKAGTLRAEGENRPSRPSNVVAVPVAFAQNTRDEVREMAVVGALAAEPGMKQTSYVRTAMQVRRLVPEECEKLQGFPVSWTAGFSDSTRYRMLGNAVAVPCAEWIARRLAAIGLGII